MKILMTHIQNTYNYGSAMMAITMIKGISELYNDKIEFYTDASTAEDVNRLIMSTGKENIYSDDYPRDNHWRNMSKIEKIFALPKKLLQFISQLRDIRNRFDAVIVLGGDDYSEYYGTRHLIVELIKVHYLSKKIPVILVGQTMGPFTSYRVNLVKWALKYCTIYTRDANCFEYLTKILRMPKIHLSSDLAFLDLPKQHDKVEENRLMMKYQLLDTPYITIVPSGLINSYTSATEEYIYSFTDLIKKLICERKYSKIVLLAHVFNIDEKTSDNFVIEKIMNVLDANTKKQVICITDRLLPYEARIILGNGLLTITGRMHAAVSTFQMQKSAVSLSYSVKYAGVIGKGLGLENLIIESANDDLWTSGHFANKVIEKIKYITTHYDEVRASIQQATQEAKNMASEQIINVVKQLGDISMCRKQ